MEEAKTWQALERERVVRRIPEIHETLAANLLINRTNRGPLWASDITYVPTSEGWLYVSAVMSVPSRKIIGLSMKDQWSEELTAAALKQAVTREKPSQGLIHHSDRGRQYASYGYQALLKRYGITPSMSRKCNCYDNAYMESFFSTLKRELVHGERYRRREEARLSVFDTWKCSIIETGNTLRWDIRARNSMK